MYYCSDVFAFLYGGINPDAVSALYWTCKGSWTKGLATRTTSVNFWEEVKIHRQTRIILGDRIVKVYVNDNYTPKKFFLSHCCYSGSKSMQEYTRDFWTAVWFSLCNIYDKDIQINTSKEGELWTWPFIEKPYFITSENNQYNSETTLCDLHNQKFLVIFLIVSATEITNRCIHVSFFPFQHV